MNSYQYRCFVLQLLVTGLVVQLLQAARPYEPDDDDLSIADEDLSKPRGALDTSKGPNPTQQHSDSKAVRPEASSEFETSSIIIAHGSIGLSREKGSAQHVRRVLKFLFHLIDSDGSGSIKMSELKGPWAGPMWWAFDKSDTANITEAEFTEPNWGYAVKAAFTDMGGHGDHIISAGEIAKWNTTEAFKTLAQRAAGDKSMTLSEFEDFLYSALAFHGLDKDESGHITFNEIPKRLLPDMPWKNEQQFKMALAGNDGAEQLRAGADVTELYGYFLTNGYLEKEKASSP